MIAAELGGGDDEEKDRMSRRILVMDGKMCFRTIVRYKETYRFLERTFAH
jgi:hypothetical protein